MRFDEVVAAVAAARGEAAGQWLGTRGDPGKWLVLRLARRLCGLTLAELGQPMDGMDYAAVSMALRRLNRRMENDPALRRQYDQAARRVNV